MRNLKKVLSLVLALAMVLSICMVGAGAVNYDDFTDEESITKKQAVETLVSLDVIKGYNDGATFNPTGNVTRAEMATMICRILAGGDNMIVDATKPVASYADIVGHWAESYIEYCTSLGIVSGKSPTSFDPDAQVTAAEAAKMVMTTLGYNADVEGFKGIGWDINTMAKANTLQLLDNLQGEISSSVPMTREQVAQLLYNALDDAIVQNYVGTSANVWISSGAERYTQTLLETKFHAQKVTGVVIANEWADLYNPDPIKKGTTQLALMDNDGDLREDAKKETYNVSTGLLDIGKSVVVFWDTNTKRVLYGNTQDTGTNVVSEIKTGYESIDKGDNAVTGSLNRDTEYFINYNDGTEGVNRSDYRIGYLIGGSTVLTDAELTDYVADYAILFPTGTAATDAEKAEEILAKELNDDVIDYIEDGQGAAANYSTTPYVDCATSDPAAGSNTLSWSIRRSITPGADFTDGDNYYIKEIFRLADRKDTTGVGGAVTTEITLGEVYVGTQSNVDISDTMSYTGFVERYLRDGTTGTYVRADLVDRDPKGKNENDNGNYIRTVDFNNDGEIDYVMQIRFNLGVVTDVDRKGDVTISDLAIDRQTRNPGDDYAGSFVCDDEVAADDVVIYTIIDGKAYGQLAESFDAEVKSYSWRNDEITTVDGDVYGQSMIKHSDDQDNVEFYADLYYTDLEDAEDKVNYTFYKDLFGYVAAFIEVETTNGLMLLTDGYYTYGLNKKDVYQIEYWNGEDKSFDTAKVNIAGSKSTNPWTDTAVDIEDFIYTDWNQNVPNSHKSEGWERLIGAVACSGDHVTSVLDAGNKAWTNLAALRLTDDTATVKYVDAKSNRSETAIAELKWDEGKGINATTDGFAAKARLLTAINPNNGTTFTVMANSRTVYYYVYNDGKNMTVNEVVGYNNSMKVEDKLVTGTDKKTIHAAYVAATTTDEYFTDGVNPGASAGSSYPVADVVVIEINTPLAGIMETAMIYSINTRSSGDVKSLDAIQGSAPKTYNFDTTWDGHYNDLNPFTFQKLTLRDGKVVAGAPITEKFGDENIFAGQINATNGVLTDDDGRYVVLTNGETVQIDPKVPVYTFSARNKNTYDIDDSNTLTTRNNGDKIIYVTNNNGVVQYVINVSKSTDGPNVIDALDTLYTNIERDAQVFTVTFNTPHGSLFNAAGNATMANTQKVSYNRSISFTIKPDNGYEVTAVNYATTNENGDPVSGALTPVAGVYTVENVKANVTVTATISAAEDTEAAGLKLVIKADGDAVANWTLADALKAEQILAEDAANGNVKLGDPADNTTPSLAYQLTTYVGAYLANMQTDAGTAVTTLVGVATGTDVTAAQTALNNAITACTTVEALSKIYDADATDLVMTNELVATLKRAVDIANLPANKTAAGTAVTTLVGVATSADVTAAKNALTKAINDCTTPEELAEIYDAETDTLVATHELVIALKNAVDAANLATNIAAAKDAVDALVTGISDATITGAATALKDAIDACTTPEELAEYYDTTAGELVEDQADIAALLLMIAEATIAEAVDEANTLITAANGTELNADDYVTAMSDALAADDTLTLDAALADQLTAIANEALDAFEADATTDVTSSLGPSNSDTVKGELETLWAGYTGLTVNSVGTLTDGDGDSTYEGVAEVEFGGVTRNINITATA